MRPSSNGEVESTARRDRPDQDDKQQCQFIGKIGGHAMDRAASALESAVLLPRLQGTGSVGRKSRPYAEKAKGAAHRFTRLLYSQQSTAAGSKSPLCAWSYGFFSTMLLPNMNPISAMARGWFAFTPLGPKTSPGVWSIA